MLRRWRWVILTIVAEAAIVLTLVAWPQLDAFARNARPIVPSAPARTNIVGVHTRLTDEVEPSKILHTATMAREMGATWMVELFPWAYMEPRRGEYDWKHSDLVVEAAMAAGLTVVARIDVVPGWARGRDQTDRYLDEARFDDFADFVGRFVDRYRGRVRYLVVWNEPNTSYEWGYRPVDPEAYTRLLVKAYSRAKEANPEVVILTAGLAPTLEQGALALNDLDYLQRMYDAGVAGYFDMMSVHAYGNRSTPQEPASADRLNFSRVELVRQVMIRNGDEAKLILITESGWNDHPRWAKAVRPAQRVAYTIEAFDKARTEWPYVVGVCTWVFRLPTPARNYNDYYTFVDAGFQAKPIYESVKAYSSSLP